MIAHPIESWGEKYVGGSMRTTLKQRHTMLDERLAELIEQSPDLQVLEIAAGLSPRGWWFRQHYPLIDYRELDLPDMAKTKQAALKQIDHKSPDVLSVDLFTEDFKKAFKVFDPQRPLVVISEGLINYFTKELLQQLIQSIAHYGQDFNSLHYLTDLYPEPVKKQIGKSDLEQQQAVKSHVTKCFYFSLCHTRTSQKFYLSSWFSKS